MWLYEIYIYITFAHWKSQNDVNDKLAFDVAQNGTQFLPSPIHRLPRLRGQVPLNASLDYDKATWEISGGWEIIHIFAEDFLVVFQWIGLREKS